MSINPSEKLWLMQHGGRNPEDVVDDVDGGGKFVYMYAPNKDKRERVYIPDLPNIIICDCGDEVHGKLTERQGNNPAHILYTCTCGRKYEDNLRRDFKYASTYTQR